MGNDIKKIRLVYTVSIPPAEQVLERLTQIGGVVTSNEVQEYEAYVDIESIQDVRNFLEVVDELEEDEDANFELVAFEELEE